ncbi:MAG: hypothetical protein WC718_00055 [Phycisphaerales bacterium]|jgi:hypothetical protein
MNPTIEAKLRRHAQRIRDAYLRRCIERSEATGRIFCVEVFGILRRGQRKDNK